MKINGMTRRQREQLEWTKRQGMEPLESVEAREKAFEAACRKVERYRLGARIDEFDFMEVPPVRHG